MNNSSLNITADYNLRGSNCNLSSVETKNENHNGIKYITYGSPLMDIIADVDSDFISRHSLKLDTTIHVDSSNLNVFEELRNSTKNSYFAGGCSYNAIRALNWLVSHIENPNLSSSSLTIPKSRVACIGSIGDDDEGEMYKKLLLEENIQPIFETYQGKVTGKCAVFCNNRNRCHLTDLGASTLISDEFINQNWDKYIKDVNLIYTELYILSSRSSTLFKLGEHCLANDKVFGFNLPSEFFLKKFSEQIIDIIAYGDVVFSNREEAKFMLNEVLKVDADIDNDLAYYLNKEIAKKNKEKPRVMVVTCGPEPAHVCVYDHLNEKVLYKGTYEPIYVDKDEIVDTNGAGDAFAGGFLAYYMNGYSIGESMMAGHYVASRVIKLRGMDIPFNEVPNIPKRRIVNTTDVRSSEENSD